MKKILHITNWYPNKWNDLEALFIKEQFNLFSQVTDSKLIHVEVKKDKKNLFKFKKVDYSEHEVGYYILSKIQTHKIIEIISTFLLLWVFHKEKAKTYDLVHFHIAYPLLTYYEYWKKILKKPVLLSEHWSAYHYNFYMPKYTRKLDRIKNIFHKNIPIITVSIRLLKDIQKFSSTTHFKSYVIPNVIDLDIYKYKSSPKNNIPIFFIVNFWRDIKNPYPMLESFSELHNQNINFKLKIGGYGPILKDIELFIKEKKLSTKIEFLGKMYKHEISSEMNNADAYLFSSNYETFSAVSAQALCSGCPIIGPKLDAIKEYASDNEMIVVNSNTPKDWEISLKKFINKKNIFNRKNISDKLQKYFSHVNIKKDYINIIKELK